MSLREEAYSNHFDYESLDSEARIAIDISLRGAMIYAAQLLREQGEREPTYQLQDAFNRAAKILEGLE